MTYYDTLDEDLTRAKEILTKGKPTADDFEGLDVASIIESLPGGTIFGGDVYAAYKLLESFVAEITKLRERLYHEGIEHSECQQALIAAQARLENDTQLATLVSDIKALAGLCKFRKVNPFDHNGECLMCDEMGEHAEECAWRLVEMIRDDAG